MFELLFASNLARDFGSCKLLLRMSGVKRGKRPRDPSDDDAEDRRFNKLIARVEAATRRANLARTSSPAATRPGDTSLIDPKVEESSKRKAASGMSTPGASGSSNSGSAASVPRPTVVATSRGSVAKRNTYRTRDTKAPSPDPSRPLPDAVRKGSSREDAFELSDSDDDDILILDTYVKPKAQPGRAFSVHGSDSEVAADSDSDSDAELNAHFAEPLIFHSKTLWPDPTPASIPPKRPASSALDHACLEIQHIKDRLAGPTSDMDLQRLVSRHNQSLSYLIH